MADLTPPDFERCQCMIRPAHGPFVLGPRPRYERCANVPAWHAVEIRPGPDGLLGSMTLCNDCAKVMMDDKELRERVQLQPIFREETPT